MSPSLVVRIGVVLLAATAAHTRADDPPYTQVGRVPRVVRGDVINEFIFDPVARRIYGRSRDGVYWVDPQAGEPRYNGPIPVPRGAIEIAPDLGRMYFSENGQHFGYVSLRTSAPPTTLVGKEWRGGRLVYEPSRKEIYTPPRFRGDAMAVYDAETGELTAEIKLPGDRVTRFEAVPGKVFVAVENRFGLHVIDAATRAVRPWPLNGAPVEPSALEVEPTGRYMIAQYDRHLVAVDIPSATVIAQLASPGLVDFAFDPERRLVVVAAHDPPGHPRVRLRVYSLNSKSFTEVAELKNPEEDYGGLTSMHGGFLFGGRHSLFLWRATPTR